MAGELGLGHLVEAADRGEAETALHAGARVVGVNNRDLATFEVDVARTEAVLPLLRESGVVSVSESGIHDRETVLRLSRAGAHALLVGEALLVAPDPGAMLRELRGVNED
jgi:indole-3-glycerol phosphate synthase